MKVHIHQDIQSTAKQWAATLGLTVEESAEFVSDVMKADAHRWIKLAEESFQNDYELLDQFVSFINSL